MKKFILAFIPVLLTIICCEYNLDTYRINLSVMADEGQHAWGDIFQINDPEAVLNFENVGLDSVRIFWNRSKYLCRYKLNRTDISPVSILLYTASDTSFVTPQPGFGDQAQFILLKIPSKDAIPQL